MLEITLTLDYETWAQFWDSINGKRVEDVILNSHCISWHGEGGENEN